MESQSMMRRHSKKDDEDKDELQYTQAMELLQARHRKTPVHLPNNFFHLKRRNNLYLNP